MNLGAQPLMKLRDGLRPTNKQEKMTVTNPKLQRTTNYSQFVRTKENREVNLHKPRAEHRDLRKSMEKYGWIPAFPLMAKSVNGHYEILDGQHRLGIAKELGLEVFFVQEHRDVCIAEINMAQAKWRLEDYAKRWAAEGLEDYLEVLSFSEQYEIPLGISFSILAGTQVLSNVRPRIDSGRYKVSTKPFALTIANTYQTLRGINKKAKGQSLIYALYKCHLLEYFEPKKIITTASRRPEMLVPCGREEAALEMLEEIYNFGCRIKVPLKFDAEQASRDRSPPLKIRKYMERARNAA